MRMTQTGGVLLHRYSSVLRSEVEDLYQMIHVYSSTVEHSTSSVSSTHTSIDIIEVCDVRKMCDISGRIYSTSVQIV